LVRVWPVKDRGGARIISVDDLARTPKWALAGARTNSPKA
jgi:hypothetical protein